MDDLLTIEQFRRRLERHVKRAHGIRPAARLLGLTPQYLHSLIHYGRRPGPKCLNAVGYELVIAYRRVPKTRGRQTAR